MSATRPSAVQHSAGGEPQGIVTMRASQLDNLSIEPAESQDQLPCSISGVFPALSGGAIGFLFGGGSAAINRLVGGGAKGGAAGKAAGGRKAPFLKHTWQEGAKSAKTFAIMSGVYSTAACVVRRLRQKEDALNGAVAGCATGLALGWGGGPASALQSCAMIGIFSYIVDRLGGGEAQAAESEARRHLAAAQRRRRDRRHQQQQRGTSAASAAGAGPVMEVAAGGGLHLGSGGGGGMGLGAGEGAPPPDVAALLQQSAAAFLTPAARWLRPCESGSEGACLFARPQRRRWGGGGSISA